MPVVLTQDAPQAGYNPQINSETLRRASLRAYEIPVSNEIRQVCAPSIVSLSRDPALLPVKASAHDVVAQASVAAISHVMHLNNQLLRLLDL